MFKFGSVFLRCDEILMDSRIVIHMGGIVRVNTYGVGTADGSDGSRYALDEDVVATW